MVFQSAPNCAKLVIEQVFNFEPMVNIVNVEYATQPSAAQLEDTAAALWAYLEASNYTDYFSANWSIQKITARGLTDVEDAYAEFDGAPNIVGTASGNDMPSSVAFVVTLRTAFTGRSARGRVYLGGWTSAWMGGNILSSTAAAGVATVWRDMKDALDATDANHVVLSRETGGVLRPTAFPYAVTDTSYSDQVADSQRRRLPNH